jgi:secreted protein with Ig-like and vWFA domain
MAKSEISAREFEKKRREEKPTSPTGTGNEVAFGRQARRRAPVSPPASVPAPVSTEASTGSERGIAGKFSDVLHDYKGNASDGDGNAPGVMQTDQSASDGPAGGANRVAGTADEEVLVLSPFAVTASKDMGYIATNTLAGSRKQTKLENPPNSIALATEQPAADLPARDVNGIVSGDLAMEGARPFKSDALKEIDQLSDARLEKAPQVKRHSEPVPVASNLTEVSAAKEPVSTFSLHVSDVSFKIAKDALAKGEEIDRERIRPEEFYNAFAYGDPSPALNEKISCHIEQAAHPLLQQRNLVRIAMKVAAAGRAAGQPLRLTVLLDTSGSMEREDRVATVRGAMAALVGLLGPNDRVTLIGFARQPRLLAESVAGDQAAELLNIIANTPAEGGTNLEEALKLGGELAQRQFEATAQNRLVLLTDGAANLGNADPGQLAASIEALRQKGIALDACGVGMEGLDDAMLEALTRKSDGRYYALNSPEDADAGFARQLAGALRPAANNVKLQVRFNPARVGSYRLIGFEKHRLREEDFRNDKVDAAELAAEEAAVAVYQVEPLPQGEGELGEVFVRFLDASTGTMVERSWTLPYEPQAPAFDRASPTLQLAGTAALVAEALQRGGKEDVARLGELTPIVNGLRGYFPHNERVADLVTMFAQLKKFEH